MPLLGEIGATLVFKFFHLFACLFCPHIVNFLDLLDRIHFDVLENLQFVSISDVTFLLNKRGVDVHDSRAKLIQCMVQVNTLLLTAFCCTRTPAARTLHRSFIICLLLLFSVLPDQIIILEFQSFNLPLSFVLVLFEFDLHVALCLFEPLVPDFFSLFFVTQILTRCDQVEVVSLHG